MESYVIACQKYQKVQRSAAQVKPTKHDWSNERNKKKRLVKINCLVRKKKSDSRKRHTVDVYQIACDLPKLSSVRIDF